MTEQIYCKNEFNCSTTRQSLRKQKNPQISNFYLENLDSNLR